MIYNLLLESGVRSACLAVNGSDSFLDRLLDWFFGDNQTKQAKELIKEARKNNIKHFKIKVTNDVGTSLEAESYGKITAHKGDSVEFEAWT